MNLDDRLGLLQALPEPFVLSLEFGDALGRRIRFLRLSSPLFCCQAGPYRLITLAPPLCQMRGVQPFTPEQGTQLPGSTPISFPQDPLLVLGSELPTPWFLHYLRVRRRGLAGPARRRRHGPHAVQSHYLAFACPLVLTSKLLLLQSSLTFLRPLHQTLISRGPGVSPILTQRVVADGVQAAPSPRDVATLCDTIITMLPNSPDVKQVALGPNGIIEGARPGAILIDMSSIAPLVSREIANKLAERKVRMLDAPVSGGEPGAIKGTLSIMVGGNKDDFEQCYPLLRAMGSSVVLVGEIGAGNVAKLANQVIVALNIAAMSEALVLATKAGVNPELVYQAIRGGLAGSNVLDAKAPLVLEGNFKPGFRINLHIKDLSNAIDTGRQVGVPMPLTAAVMELMQVLKVEGLGDADHCSVVRFYEKLARTEVRRKM